MTERNFVAGDKIVIWDANDDTNRREVFLANCNDTSGGCNGLHLFDPYDEEFPCVEFKEAIIDHPEMYGYELVTPFEDALPTEPGKYKEDYEARVRKSIPASMPELFVELLVADELESYQYKGQSWTLNEDGTWTDPDGVTQPTDKNWLLAAYDYTFTPVSGDEQDENVSFA